MGQRLIVGCVSMVLLCAVARSAHAAGAAFYPLGSDRNVWVVSHNGQFVVTKKTSGDVYRWSAASGQQTAMGFNTAGGTLRGVSDDGNVVTGYTSLAFRWTAASGIVDL